MKSDIKILKDAIKFKIDGKEQRTPVWYSQGDYGDKLPKGTITVYAKRYKHLPRELSSENNSDIQTDYFEEDRARITPTSPYYNKVLNAMRGKEKSREQRGLKKQSQVAVVDHELIKKINKLANAYEENTLYDYEVSGYMIDKQRRDIFRNSAKHNVRHKLRYAYIDQGNSGKLLVSTSGADKGGVFGIKGYGQKGYYEGNIDKVLKDVEESNKNMLKLVMKRSMEKRK